jgi:Mn2+/Fe2+ NRAMP family transporter
VVPHVPLGTVTTPVQAGIQLPSTLVLLVLLDDKHLLGPLTNGRWLDATALVAIAAGPALSTRLLLRATSGYGRPRAG